MPLAAMATDASLTRHTHNLLLPSLKLTQWRAKCAVRGPIEKRNNNYFYYYWNRKDITIAPEYTEKENTRDRRADREWHWSGQWKSPNVHREMASSPSYFGSTFVRYWGEQWSSSAIHSISFLSCIVVLLSCIIAHRDPLFALLLKQYFHSAQ